MKKKKNHIKLTDRVVCIRGHFKGRHGYVKSTLLLGDAEFFVDFDVPWWNHFPFAATWGWIPKEFLELEE